MNTRELTPQEIALLLAGLRNLEHQILRWIPDSIGEDILQDGGVNPRNPQVLLDIDHLCESINGNSLRTEVLPGDLPETPLHLRMTVDVEYDLSELGDPPATEEDMRWSLENLVVSGIGDGLLTGKSNACVISWNTEIETVETSPIETWRSYPLEGD